MNQRIDASRAKKNKQASIGDSPLPRPGGSHVGTSHNLGGSSSRSGSMQVLFLALVGVAVATLVTMNEQEFRIPSMTTAWGDAVSAESAEHIPYPRPQLERNQGWRSMTGQWDFDSSPASINPEALPSPTKTFSETIVVPFPIESKLSGVQKLAAKDRMWYRRTYSGHDTNLKEGGRTYLQCGTDQSLLLHFERVDWLAKIYVNGELLASHAGGFDRFSVVVPRRMTVSGSPLQISVGVFDSHDAGGYPIGKQMKRPFGKPGKDGFAGIFYTPASGIWAEVWMECASSKLFVEEKGIDILTDVETSLLRVQVTPCVTLTYNDLGDSDDKAKAPVPMHETRIKVYEDWDMKSPPVLESLSTASESGTSEHVHKIDSPRLWIPGPNPFLYRMKIEVLVQGQVVDETTSYFGFRSISKQVFTLGSGQNLTSPTINGEPVYMFGPLDQGYWPDGIFTPPSDEALLSDLLRIQEMGYNLVRKHIKVESRRWFYHCDRIGLLSWIDMPNRPQLMATPGYFPEKVLENGKHSVEQFYHELAQVVEENRNSPSLVQWVPFNEGWGQPIGDWAAERAVQLINKIDPTRLVNDASGGHCWARGFKWFWGGCHGDVTDHHIYPGPSWKDFGISSRIRPSTYRAIGEFGGISLGVPGHIFHECGGPYGSTDSQEELLNTYRSFASDLIDLVDQKGVVSAVYTQIVDVENECNGLITYDRRVIKVEVESIREANRKVIRHLVNRIKGRPIETIEHVERQVSPAQAVFFWLWSVLL